MIYKLDHTRRNSNMDCANLARCLDATLSPDPRVREESSRFLLQNVLPSSVGLECLLSLSVGVNPENPTSSSSSREAGSLPFPLSDGGKLAAAVAFKNGIKKRWSVDAEEAEEEDAKEIEPEAKARLRVAVLEKALNGGGISSSNNNNNTTNNENIKSQLAEALQIIASSDLTCTREFPNGKWPELTPSLASATARATAEGDLGTVGSCLTVANAIFKRFRGATKTDALYVELKMALDGFAKPLLEVTRALAKEVCGGGGTESALKRKQAVKALRLCLRIFYSLNSQELPEVFEDDIAHWMELFHGILNAESGSEGVDMDALRAAICDALNLYAEKNEEEFKPYLETFVRDVWTLLGNYSKEKNNSNTSQQNDEDEDEVERHRERVASSGMAFLTVVASGVHHKLFEAPETLQNIIENIAIPNLQFRTDDEEIFTDNFAEYLRRDMEGGDQETRRRAACELIKALASKFPQSCTAAVGGYVQQLLAQYNQNPSVFWKAKDCAIYLVLALAVKKKTNARGATEINELVDVTDFFNAHIKSELCENAKSSHPVVRADCLKFLTVFRGFVPREAELQMLPHLAASLVDSSNVVHSYAANCLEKMMTCRDYSQLQQQQQQQNSTIAASAPVKFTPNDFAPFANDILQNCFNGFELQDSGENEFIAKLIAKTLRYVGGGGGGGGGSASTKLLANEVVFACCEKLCKRLDEAANNPRNPTYNHFLFEATTACVQCVDFSPSSQEKQRVENALFPTFMSILARDNAEFTPYVFQILALMLESSAVLSAAGGAAGSGITLTEQYVQLLPALLAPQTWDRQANIPALVRLLDAYLKAAPVQIAQLGYLTGVLGVFQKLISSKAHDHQGFYILNAFAKSLDLSIWSEYLPTIWQVLFQRLQTGKTPKFCRGFVVFLSVLVAKRGADAAISTMSTIQAGIHEMILSNIFAVESVKVAKEEKKLVAAAGARFLCETDLLNTNAQCWRDVCAASARCVDAYLSTAEQDGKTLAPNGTAATNNNNNNTASADEIDLADELLEKIEQQGGYSASYSQLSAAKTSKADDDILKDSCPDVEIYFGQHLAQLAQRDNQSCKQSLAMLDADAQSVVFRCFQKVGFSL